MHFVDNLKVKHKLTALIGVALIGVILTTLLAVLPLKDTLLEDRKTKTRHLVEVAHATLSHFYDMERSGLVSREEAQRQAMMTVKSLRYEENDYFWINDMHPTMVMHPIKPKLDGKDLSSFEDPNGTRLFVEFVDTVKAHGGGFVYYLWPKPGFDDPVPKVSYVKGFQPWGWVIGSGIYLDDVNQRFTSELIKFAVIGGGAALALVVISVLIARSISGRINQLRTVMTRIQEDGNLTRRVPVTGGDELGEMGKAFNGLLDGFQGIISQIHASSAEIANDAGELSTIAEQITSSTRQQSESAASTATAVDQIGASITQVAEHAQNAELISNEANELSSQGEKVVQDAAAEMGEIAGSVGRSSQIIVALGGRSKQISEIIKVIKDVADQTNLLALNAAIEAARAGEQGRGFAVVADEVRGLAKRTGKATNDIAEMIGAIQNETKNAVSSMEASKEQVEKGVALASQAAESLGKINAGAQRTVGMIGDIANATREQSTASREISAHVSRIVQMTEESRAVVMQTTEAAAHLRNQAQRLEQAVSRFRV